MSSTDFRTVGKLLSKPPTNLAWSFDLQGLQQTASCAVGADVESQPDLCLCDASNGFFRAPDGAALLWLKDNRYPLPKQPPYKA